MLPRLLNARTTLRHCMTNESKPEVTMQDTPPQSGPLHSVSKSRSGDDALMLQDRHKHGPAERAAEHHAGGDAQPGQAPAAMKMGSQGNITVRPDPVLAEARIVQPCPPTC